MVCIVCFDVLVLIRFLKRNRYSREVIKPVNNPDMTQAIFHWLKLVSTVFGQTMRETQVLFKNYASNS